MTLPLAHTFEGMTFSAYAASQMTSQALLESGFGGQIVIHVRLAEGLWLYECPVAYDSQKRSVCQSEPGGTR
jgi:hypothetical protein